DIVDKVANCSYNAENCGGTDRVFGYPLSEEPYISSCQDVYNAGLWIHGTYYSSDSSSFYCNIKENSTACDQGWISHGGHCYKLTHVQKNFDQAIQACAADNAHLVTVNSASEMNFLKNLIPTRPSLLYEWYFFIGFYDFADTKASTWLDGALSKYKYFHGVAPNTFGYKCNILMRSQHYKWRDWLCTETEGYICEKSPEYIGCFDRVQDGEVVLTNSKMSIQYCRQTCMAKSYDYAALLNGNACHCVTNDGTNATAFDLHSPLPMTSCSTPCLANDKQYCGAANKFNVYQASGLSSPEYAQSCYELEMAGLPSGEYIIKPSGGSPSTVNCTMES
ncbi:uncharacterized protein LOC112041979, partial [Lingula anatina]|uniref:Uncharacterized protein LOC112041979 n=1 Tax=Lingula anatina TaxID=7574 RepID=A0A2R2MN20_LINAN